jgi:hypothetical protein
MTKGGFTVRDLDEAARIIEALAEALEAFAEWAGDYEETEPDEIAAYMHEAALTVWHLRRARAALALAKGV